MNNFYVYLLKRPCGIPFYVGKGRGRRAYRHLNSWHLKTDANRKKVHVIEEIFLDGRVPLIEMVATGLSEESAFAIEKEQIKLYGRMDSGGPLTNMSDGGEGQTGYRHTDDLKAKFSSRFSNERNPFYGKKHTPDSLKLIGDTNRGKTLDSEWRKKLSEATKGRRMSQQHKDKIRRAHKNREISAEQIRRLVNMNKARIGKPLSQAHKDKLSASQKGISKPRKNNMNTNTPVL